MSEEDVQVSEEDVQVSEEDVQVSEEDASAVAVVCPAVDHHV